MKRHLLLLLVLLSSHFAWGQVHFESGSTSLIKQLAEQQRKLIFIDLTADWCGYCRWMESEVFAKQEVGDSIHKHFVAARYDVDLETGSKLFNRYGNGGIPLMLVFDREWKLLGRIEGALPADQLIAELQRLVQKYQKQALTNKLHNKKQ